MKTIFNIFFVLLLGFSTYAQNVGVNSTGAAPDNSSMLDVVSTDKGVLIPRVNIADLSTAAPVTAPVTSLLVYNTNVTSGEGYYFWDGTKWTKLEDDNSNPDEDWHEVGGTTAPDNINDNIFTQGNVGIGTITPNAPLDLGNLKLDKGNGNVAVASDVFMEGQGLIAAENNLFINIDSDNDATGDLFLTKGTETSAATKLVTLLNNGNMGVGRSNPQIKFVVSEGNSANTSVALEGFNSGYAGLPTILPATGSHFGGIVHGGTNGQLILGIRENDVNDGLLIASGGGNYNTDNTYDNAILFARNDGNIGVGTVTPSSKLFIKQATDDAATSSLRIENSGGTAGSLVTVTSDNKTYIGAQSTFDGPGANIDNGIYIANNTGNVGIGTHTPVTQLQITNGTNYGNIMLGNDGGTTNNHITHETSGDFVVWNGTFGTGNRLMSIMSNGRVISHLTSQSTALKPSGWGGGLESNWDVWAAASVGGGVTGTAATWSISNAGVAAKPGGGAWNATSDMRTKKEVNDFTDGLNVLSNINPVTFKYNGFYNTPNDNKTYVGIIAQEVQEVAPYMIGSYEAPKYEDSESVEEILNYDGGTYMLYVIVNSVKELQKENELLRQELKELREKLEQR